MKKELINGVIDAVMDFVSACANDVVAPESEEEYTIFDGAITADKNGNIKTYSSEGKLVAQVPVRPILSNLKKLGYAMVDLYEADKAEADEKAKAEEKAEAEAAEAENQEINEKIENLQSEISSLKLQKKSVRRYVKRF